MDISQLLSGAGSQILKETLKALDGADQSTLAPVAALLGVKPQTLATFLQLLPKIVNKEVTLSSIYPAILPAFLSYYASLGAQNESPAENTSAEPCENNIEDLEYVAGGVFSSLELYEQNSSAS